MSTSRQTALLVIKRQHHAIHSPHFVTLHLFVRMSMKLTPQTQGPRLLLLKLPRIVLSLTCHNSMAQIDTSSFVLRFFNTMYNKLRKSQRKKIWEKYTAMSWFSCTVNNIAFIVVNVTCTSLIQFRLWKTSLDLREDKFGSFVCLSVWGCLFLDLNTISYIIFNESSLISEVVYSVKWRKMGQFSEVTIVICLTWDTMYHDISWSTKLLGKSSPS